ncbi:ABC-type transport system involved in multi-copper enzyme maturation permease subunit [Streptomyces achromogenes]|uniref:ABC-type transport system involved in multi-copper enzyme maturation permease subunit n=1 Tax=Streptomyces achromogenes TaxID=67255 RepID=A0ABU0QDB2_STRAH|nr:ABC transporter permease subunit [Streptomyces achromogenes]MDQ0688641.1 ABC-type transport system involved in multi-copper enzyme maturation permease subunit [Streptomyces achromogenes]MDQ0835833.1 ABC-type transport system involved in multi-copper enzyme maturation permease subunit [Streptomyces achromogenes]
MSTFTRPPTDGENRTTNETMNGTMNATKNGPRHGARNATTTQATRRPRLSGMTWLVWRQHRAAFWTMIAATVLCVAWMVYQRGQMMDFLGAYGFPAKNLDDAEKEFKPYIGAFTTVTTGLTAIPVMLGVLLGAPLLAGDLENGTAKLIAAQSVSRNRWLATKLALAGLVVTVTTVTLSAVFAWWWSPIKLHYADIDWASREFFNTTGPVPVALSLLSVFGGVLIGVILRRTLAAMVVTLGFTVALQAVWGYFKLSLGDIVTATSKPVSPGTTITFPSVPRTAHWLDTSYVSGSGKRFDLTTCADTLSEEATTSCMKKADIVGASVDYLPISQMSGMQWLGASILFALTVGIVAFLFIWGRKRLV